MKMGKTILALLVLVAAFVGYRLLTERPAAPDKPVRALPRSTQVVDPEVMAEPPAQSEPSISEKVPADEPGCLTIREIEEHPLIIQDAYRMNAVSAAGPDIEAYRGIDEASIRAYADQGDSASMALTGANAVMRAYGIDESEAIAWLSGDRFIPDLVQYREPLSPEAGLELNDAAYWFYQAALHGRLFALQHYGSVRGRIFGGAVGLGWIGREDYDALNSRGRTALDPGNVYQRAAYDIAPQLQEGALGVLADLIFESELQREIRAGIVEEFNETLDESGLPPINVPATASPSLDELRKRICATELREIERRQELDAQ